MSDDSESGRILPGNLRAMCARAVLAAVLPASLAGAQLTSPTMSDATIVSRGAWRFRGNVEWARIDGVFGPGGSTLVPLGSSLTGDLDVNALPLLGTGQDAAQAMTGDPSLHFTAGQLTTSADSRIVSVPLSLEYGLTRRITVGVSVPIVQSRTIVTSQLNGPRDSTANVGTNPAFFHGSAAAYGANASVATALAQAQAQLQSRLVSCSLNPAGAGCAAVNGRQAEADALMDATASFVLGIDQLYGTSSDDAPGAPFVPIAGSAPQNAIDAKLASLRTDYASFGVSAGAGALAAAQAPAANAQFDSLITKVDFGIELDSLGSTQQTSVGDIELSARALLFDNFAAANGPRLRAAAEGVVRLGTGRPARPDHPYDVPTGDGQTDLEVRGAMDALTGRFLTTVAGTFTLQTGSVATTRLPALPGAFFGLDFPVAGSIKYGNMASLRVNPRYLITPALMVGALGVGSWRGADEVTVTGFNPGGTGFGNPNALTTLAGGLTIAYSNLASATGIGGRNFPAEVVFSHLETLTASAAGARKASRDAIELRIYLRARR